MKCRRAEVSFEAILAVAFIALMISTLFAVYQFYSGRSFAANGDQEMAVEYHDFLNQMRAHMRFATEFEVGDGFVILKTGSENVLATYRLLDSKIVCFDADDKGQTVVNGIQSADFRPHPRISGLLMVSMFPEDQMYIPFFTSFALRGISDDGQ